MYFSILTLWAFVSMSFLCASAGAGVQCGDISPNTGDRHEQFE